MPPARVRLKFSLIHSFCGFTDQSKALQPLDIDKALTAVSIGAKSPARLLLIVIDCLNSRPKSSSISHHALGAINQQRHIDQAVYFFSTTNI